MCIRQASAPRVLSDDGSRWEAFLNKAWIRDLLRSNRFVAPAQAHNRLV